MNSIDSGRTQAWAIAMRTNAMIFPCSLNLRRFTAALLFFLAFTVASDLSASHFRAGQITWAPDPAVPGKIDFTMTTSWRRSFFCSGTSSCVGNSYSISGGLDYGDGSDRDLVATVISEDLIDDVFTMQETFSHTYTTSGSFTVAHETCCRIGNSSNGSNGDYRVFTTVSIDLTDWANNNSPPTSSLPAIVFIQQGMNDATFTIPGFDPDGDPITYRLPTSAEVGISQPTGFSVASNGVATLMAPTGGFQLGANYSAAVIISDGQSDISLDFLIQVVGTSTPPAFDYSVTPQNNTLFDIGPLDPITFTVKVDDPDANSQVALSVTGSPSSATYSPALPLAQAAGPRMTTFSWTPGASDLGTFVITFVARDEVGVQTITTVNVRVGADPIFINPTPGQGSAILASAGQSFSQIYQARDPNTSSSVQIEKVEVLPNLPPTPGNPPFVGGGGFPGRSMLPSGLSFSPTLPTAFSNPVMSELSGTIAAADFGIYQLEVTAENDVMRTRSTRNFVIVDQAPQFTTPEPTNLSAVIGEPFTLVISATDADLPFGDEIAFADAAKTYTTFPSWVNLSDDGNGNLTITGTPTLSDLGSNNFRVELHDRTTHFMHSHFTWQFQNFTVEVVDCEFELAVNFPTVGTDFETVPVNAGKSFEYMISNQGASTLQLTGTPAIEITGADAAQFSITSQPTATSIAAGGPDQQFTVRYNPTTNGMHTATVSIDNDRCDAPYTFQITGRTGIARVFNPIINRYYPDITAALLEIPINNTDEQEIMISAGAYSEDADYSNRQVRISIVDDFSL